MYRCTNGSDRPVSSRDRNALAVSAYSASVMQPINTKVEPKMSDCSAGEPRPGRHRLELPGPLYDDRADAGAGNDER